MASTKTKYLVFGISEERYGIPVAKVREVIRHERITPVHEASAFLKGVINLRGKIIPIIDMRAKFGMTELDYTDRTVFIIVDVAGTKDPFQFGIAVDAVHEVVDLDDADHEALPNMGFKLRSSYLLSIAKVGSQMLMLLDMDKILQSQEVVDLQNLGAAPGSELGDQGR
jgi:purine-binding chemotaxis protein CheW